MRKDKPYSPKEELLQKYLDGELNAEEEKNALHVIAENPELREMLRFERSLYLNLHESDSDIVKVPDNFSESVMQRIDATYVSDQPVTDKIRHAVISLFQPRQLSFRPVWAVAAVLFIGILLFLSETEQMDLMELRTGIETETVRPEYVAQQEEEQEIWIRFIYFDDDDANEVSVAGDFSDWEPIELNREYAGEKQVWTGMIPITRGEHRYMFVRDGEEWITDPLAEIQRDDGFGNKNAVIYL